MFAKDIVTKLGLDGFAEELNNYADGLCLRCVKGGNDWLAGDCEVVEHAHEF